MNSVRFKLFILAVFLVALVSIKAQSPPQPLLDLIARKEFAVKKICSNMQLYYSEHEQIAPGGCLYHTACKNVVQGREDWSTLPALSCQSGFGKSSHCSCNNAQISKEKPVTMFSPTTQINSKEVDEFTCFTARLTDIFLENYQNDTNLKWQYVGSEQGVHQSYPGRSWQTELNSTTGCNEANDAICPSYDPRSRPWYISAGSGPKNVILILDTSGSMSAHNRMQLMRSAANAVIDGLGYLDYANVVEFNTNAKVCSFAPDELVQATAENKQKLRNCINDLREGGWTNFGDAFKKAFDLLDRSYGDTIKCNNVMLFMTDGEVNRGPEPLSLIRGRNTNDYNAKIFSYSFGAEADQRIPKQISCEHKGVFANIPDGGNLRGRMSGYFRYFAFQGETERPVTWSEFYEDFGGLGTLTTATFPCFASNGKLLAVAGVDIPQDELTGVATLNQVSNELRTRSAKCPNVELTTSQIEELRGNERCHATTSSVSKVPLPLMSISFMLLLSLISILFN